MSFEVNEGKTLEFVEDNSEAVTLLDLPASSDCKIVLLRGLRVGVFKRSPQFSFFFHPDNGFGICSQTMRLIADRLDRHQNDDAIARVDAAAASDDSKGVLRLLLEELKEHPLGSTGASDWPPGYLM